jgi:hypothetical protein
MTWFIRFSCSFVTTKATRPKQGGFVSAQSVVVWPAAFRAIPRQERAHYPRGFEKRVKPGSGTPGEDVVSLPGV